MDYPGLLVGALLLPFVGLFFMFLLRNRVNIISSKPLQSLVTFCVVGTALMWVAAPVSPLAQAPAWVAAASTAMSAVVSFGILSIAAVKKRVT